MDRRLWMAAVVLGLAAIAWAAGGNSSPGGGSADAASDIAEGAALYDASCASCHGANLEGAPNWQTPNADGSYNPPPQDASGHTWHHGDPTLVQLISQGSPFPQSRMPAFGDELSDEQIGAILDFIKSTWGEQEKAFQQQATERDLAATS